MQTALAEWVQTAGHGIYCHTGDLPHCIYNGLRGRYPRDEVVRIWRKADTIIAFALVYPRHKGFDVFVSPDFRGGDLEREVLTWATTNTRAWMDREGNQSEPVLADVYDRDEHRAVLLAELGYSAADDPWIVINEQSLDSPLPEVDLPAGYTIQSGVVEQDATKLCNVHVGAFGSEWTPQVYLDEVMRKPGYDPAMEHVIVAPDGSFAAFCVIWLDDLNGIGLFEPVGTHKQHQRKGLGRALLIHGLNVMINRGMRLAHVGSTTKNEASNGLYQAVGFVPRYPIFEYKYE